MLMEKWNGTIIGPGHVSSLSLRSWVLRVCIVLVQEVELLRRREPGRKS